MSNPIITLDIHGYDKIQAMLEIDSQLKMLDKSIYQIKIIHGYNNGTILRNMINKEFKRNKKIKRIMPGSNLGETILVIREL